MRGKVSKLARRKIMSDLNMQGLRGPVKIVVFKRGCRETKKKYNTLNDSILPKVILMNKQHIGEPLDKFRARRKISNKRRREREKQYATNNQGNAGLEGEY